MGNKGGGWLDHLSVGDLGRTKLNNFSAVKLGYANVNGQEGRRIAHFPNLISEPFCQEIAHVFSGTYLGTCCSVKKVASQHNLITYRLRDLLRHIKSELQPPGPVVFQLGQPSPWSLPELSKELTRSSYFKGSACRSSPSCCPTMTHLPDKMPFPPLKKKTSLFPHSASL